MNWGSGTMDLTSTNTQWSWAVKTGSAIKDKSQTVFLDLHDQRGRINFDLTVARGGNSLNPFAVSISTTGSGSAPAATVFTQAGSVGSSSTGGGGDFQRIHRATIAHGAILGLAFAFLFPVGAILIRIFSFPGLIWVHAATQIFAYVMAIVGLGLGVYIALNPERQVSDRFLISSCIVAFVKNKKSEAHSGIRSTKTTPLLASSSSASS